MKTLAESEKELSEDVTFLKGLYTETQGKVTDLRKQFKRKMKGAKKKDAHLLTIMMNITSKEHFEFLDLTSLIKSLVSNDTIDLSKIRQARDTFIKLVINLDKVTLSVLSKTDLTVFEQIAIYLHIFDGINDVDEQVKTLNELKRLTRNRNEISPLIASVEGLAIARILMSFYVKWLTRAEDEFVDRKLESSLQMQKEFIITLKKILQSLSNAKSQAENESKYEARIELLHALIKAIAEENKFQQFFEENPDFLNRQVSSVISKKSFGGEQFPDLILVLSNGNYVVVELEKPAFRLFTVAGDPTKELSHAEQQVRGYLAWANEDKEFLRKRGLEKLSAENTTGLVIIGAIVSNLEKRKLESLNDTIRSSYVVKTFRDVLEENEACLQNLRKYPLKLDD
jgi:hypothetical protein